MVTRLRVFRAAAQVLQRDDACLHFAAHTPLVRLDESLQPDEGIEPLPQLPLHGAEGAAYLGELVLRALQTDLERMIDAELRAQATLQLGVLALDVSQLAVQPSHLVRPWAARHLPEELCEGSQNESLFVRVGLRMFAKYANLTSHAMMAMEVINAIDAKPKLLEFLSGRGRRGMLNTSNSCYIASALQLLGHCPAVVHFVLRGHSDAPAVRAVRNVFIAQWLSAADDVRSPVSLEALVQALQADEAFRRAMDLRRQNDAQEFLTKLVESVERGVGSAVAMPAALRHVSDDAALSNVMDRAWFDAHHRSYSRLTGLVHGQLLCETKCGICGHRHPSSDIFTTLPVDLLGPSDASGRLSLAECMTRQFSPERLEGTGWRCDACKQVPDVVMRSCGIWRAPKVLLVCIKRFECDTTRGKRTERLRLPKYVDFTRVLCQQDGTGKRRRATYRLMSFVCHHGSAHCGHYVAYARDSVHDEWCEFDDESVQRVAFDRIDTSGVYMLAYERFVLDSESSSTPPGTSSDPKTHRT